MLYLLLAWSWQGAELIAGTVSAGLVAALLMLIRHRSEARFVVRPGWFWPLAQRLPAKALADCAVVLRGALRPTGATGAFRAVPFDKDAGNRSGEAAARRALVVAGASIAPNSVVVAVDNQRDRLLVHQFIPTHAPPGDGDRLWPL